MNYILTLDSNWKGKEDTIWNLNSTNGQPLRFHLTTQLSRVKTYLGEQIHLSCRPTVDQKTTMERTSLNKEKEIQILFTTSIHTGIYWIVVKLLTIIN